MFFQSVTKVKLPASNQVIWVSSKIQSQVNQYLKNLEQEYQNQTDSQEILSSYELGLCEEFYPLGSSKANPVTPVKWVESSFASKLIPTINGFYRLRPSLGAGVLSGLDDKFGSLGLLKWIFRFGIFVGFLFNPIIWICIYIFLAFTLPQKHELNQYAGPEKYLSPILSKTFGVTTMVIAIGQIIYYSYLLIGFCLIRFANWPKTWIDSNLLSGNVTWFQTVTGLGLLATCLMIAIYGFRIGQLAFKLEIFTIKIKSVILPMMILGLIFFGVSTFLVPLVADRDETVTKILSNNSVTDFYSNLDPVYLNFTNQTPSVRYNFIFQKSDKPEISVRGQKNLINNIYEYAPLETNWKGNLQLNYPLKICYGCEGEVTIIIKTSSLKTVVVPNYDSTITFIGYTEAEAKTFDMNPQNDDWSRKVTVVE